MTVRQTQERYVYAVPSESNPRVSYRVDIVANGGAGRCACTDFGTRRQPNLDAGMPMHTRDTSCKHVRAVHQYFLRELLSELAHIEEGKQ
jgi:hypothetical protein